MPELGLFPLPQLFLFALHPRPSPREGVNEAGLGEAGRRPSVHRCLQVFPWWPDPGLAPLCSCLSTLPDMGWWLIPLWGGVGAPARVWALPAKTPPWRPRVCLAGMAVFPSWALGVGQVGLGQPQGWLKDRGAERWGAVRCQPQAWGTWSPLAFFSLCTGWLGLWLFLLYL